MDKESQAKLESEIDEILASLDIEEDPNKTKELLLILKEKQDSLLNDKRVEDTCLPERESRVRKQTEKMSEYQQGEKERKARGLSNKFSSRYLNWKDLTKKGRSQLKNQCTEPELDSLHSDLNAAKDELVSIYDEIRKINPPEQVIRRQVDTCSAITSELIRIIDCRKERIGEPVGQTEMLSVLPYDGNKSIFSTEIQEVSSRKSETPQRRDNDNKSLYSAIGSGVSHNSKTSYQRRIDAAAELAALEAEEKVRKDQETKQAELDDLSIKVLAKQRELNRLKSQKDLEKARARYKVYDSEINPDNDRNTSDTDSLAMPRREKERNTAATHITPAVAQIIHDSITLGRLPAPEPSVFTGDPLKYVEWKTNFRALIGSKGLPVAERMYFLKRYLGGSALKAVEGYFYDSSEESYKGAWDLLEERFGHKFKIQEAFRNKLCNWDKIDPKDSAGLQSFADFLRACKDATPHVFGLEILNDSKENQKLVAKLPDGVAARWNRDVTLKMDEREEYPTFSEFVKFVAREAKIACNPITSFSALKALDISHASKVKETKGATPKVKEPRSVIRDKGSAFATNSKEHDKSDASELAVKPKICVFCKGSDHHISTCPKFEKININERKQYVVANSLCFSCLKRGHNSRDCQRKLYCMKCKLRHPTVLHENRETSVIQSQGAPSVTEPPEMRASPNVQRQITMSGKSKESASTMSCTIGQGEIISTSMIVPVWVSTPESPNKEVLTYALLDTQSDSTFVLEETAKAVTDLSQPINLKLSTMTSSSTIECFAVNDLLVRGMTMNTQIRIPRAYTREFIPVDLAHIPTSDTASKWPHLEKIAHDMAPLQSCDVGLLIGYNCPQALIPREVIVSKNEEPYAIKTDLGWSIIGHGNTPCLPISTCHRVSVKESPAVSMKDITNILERDFSERCYGEKVVSQEDLQFLDIMESNIRQSENGHYVMPLPFRSPKPSLPNNKRAALIRLNHLKKKLIVNREYFEHYKIFMAEIIERGDTEKVTGNGKDGEVWYLPHHGVYHPQKPGKIRVVFDAAARYAGTSLNEHLLTGPDLINGLIGVLCRFREHSIAVMCDIEKMFHQFFVEEDHRDYLRFLWWEKGNLTEEPQEFRMKVHLFGAASSPGCANYGLKTLAQQNQTEFPLASKIVRENFYIDDGLFSVDTVEKAIEIVEETRELCTKGKLRLHKFMCNSREVLQTIPVSERAACLREIELNEQDLPIERVLGIRWCVESDSFNFDIQSQNQTSSRRGILSTVASIYDPLGFISPFVLIGKIILQEMCKSGICWDDPLPETMHPRWEKWCADFTNLKDIRIPRCYKPKKFGQVIYTELHHFSDASMNGYGQCSYLRFVSEQSVHCSLVCGKSRVAPSKAVTIPRLELTAAVVSAKMSGVLKQELGIPIDREYFWTDSKVVLAYISNEAKRFHIFVSNRVQIIRQTSEPSQWHYVSTEMNPADHASRGLFALEMKTSNWFNGPSFLWDRELIIPETQKHELSIGDPEVKVSTVLKTVSTKESLDLIGRCSRFSDWSNLVSAVARIKRVARNCKANKGFSTPDERQDAERFIVKLLQENSFPKEVKLLRENMKIPRNSRIFSLCPFLDKYGILRVGGRLSKACVSDTIKHPAILPKDNHVTKLLISHFHRKVQHQGRGLTLNELRANGYWVINGVKEVAYCIHKCFICRRNRRPTEEQKMSDLPEDRLEPSPPFSFCGMDCFGPFLVKEGRRECKRYGLLFTCMSSRAIHIEMIDDMSTDSFLNGLRCFIAIRGTVQQLRSDQGSNFLGAKNELKEALKELSIERVAIFLAKRECTFLMNAPHSSHTGGVWERQIRTVRSILSTLLLHTKGRLDSSSLRTFFYEAMAIVNSRPLTTCNLSNPMDPMPLTPNHILTMKSSSPLPPPGNFVREDLYLRKRWRRVQFLAEQFWSRWRKEYLQSLNSRQKWVTPRRNVCIGDIVLLRDDEAPRMDWPLAIVVETKEGDDGLVRRAKVRLGNKKSDGKKSYQCKPSVLERPIQKLVVLLEANA